VSRRRNSWPWAATSVPEIRRQWCNALDASVAHQSTAIENPPDVGDSPGARRLQSLTAKLAESLKHMSDETDAIRAAELYWVSRDMVDVAVEASESLPEWTPAVAAPAPNGLLCWAKPADTVPWTAAGGGPHTDVTWDAMWWWTRSDGVLQLQPVSRLARNPELLAPYQVSSPLWAASTTLVVNPLVPRTEEATGSAEASRFVSILGAAWLLMGQPVMATTRALNTGPADGRPADPAPGAAPPQDPARVTIVELRRPISPPRDRDSQPSGRQFQRRWWVGGHWRQQACGPNHSQRKPTWISSYIKGPDGLPLTKDRIHVWRR